jgi:zinc transporter ZupT
MLKKEALHVHEHEDHFHIHEHHHGEKDNIKVTLIGFIIHSLADGFALGASLFCKIILRLLI